MRGTVRTLVNPPVSSRAAFAEIDAAKLSAAEIAEADSKGIDLVVSSEQVRRPGSSESHDVVLSRIVQESKIVASQSLDIGEIHVDVRGDGRIDLWSSTPCTRFTPLDLLKLVAALSEAYVEGGGRYEG